MKKLMLMVLFLGVFFSLSSCKSIRDEYLFYFSVMKGDQYGAINHLGDEIIPFSYDMLSPFTIDHIALAKDSEGFHLINIDNEKLQTHSNMKLVEEKYTTIPRTPERPNYFEAIENDKKLIYNSKAELIFTFDNVRTQGIVMIDDYLTVFNEEKNYEFDVNNPRFDLINHYDQINRYFDKDGYLASQDNVYTFFDQAFNILKEVEIKNGYIYEQGGLIIHKDGTTSFVYDKNGEKVGNPNGYQGLISFVNSEYIIYEDALTRPNELSVDHISGARLSNPSYKNLAEFSKRDMIIGMNQDIFDLFDGGKKVFSLNGYNRVHTFFKADKDIYVISSCCSDTSFEKGVYYVNKEGQVLSTEFKSASPFNAKKIAYVKANDENYYMINKDFDIISNAYLYIEYIEDIGLYYAKKIVSENEPETFYLLDEEGIVIYTGVDKYYIGNQWIVSMDQFGMSLENFSNLYFITKLHQVIEAKDMTYDMFKTLELMKPYDSTYFIYRDHIITNFFRIMTINQEFQYEYTLYDGFYVFSQDGKYMILTFDLKGVGFEMYDSISRMPTYPSLI